MSKRLRLNRISVKDVDQHRGTWEMGRKAVRGVEHVYAVTDENYDRLHEWEFAVQVPKGQGEIIVRPRTAPGKAVWAGVTRKSLAFVRATRAGYTQSRYCKVVLADPSGKKTKIGLGWGKRKLLPPWMKPLRRSLRLKATVRPTRGTDGHQQVLLVKSGDHRRMIRAFFALKVWVLDRNYQLPEG